MAQEINLARFSRWIRLIKLKQALEDLAPNPTTRGPKGQQNGEDYKCFVSNGLNIMHHQARCHESGLQISYMSYDPHFWLQCHCWRQIQGMRSFVFLDWATYIIYSIQPFLTCCIHNCFSEYVGHYFEFASASFLQTHPDLVSSDNVYYNCVNFEALKLMQFFFFFPSIWILLSFNWPLQHLTSSQCILWLVWIAFVVRIGLFMVRLYSLPQFLEGLHESQGSLFLQFCELEKVVIDVNKTLNLVEIALEFFENLQFFPKKLLPQCENSPKQETLLFMMLSYFIWFSLMKFFN